MPMPVKHLNIYLNSTHTQSNRSVIPANPMNHKIRLANIAGKIFSFLLILIFFVSKGYSQSLDLNATFSSSAVSHTDTYLAKRPQQAFVRSLVLPGWGQRWGERPSRGTFYTGVEAALWTGLFYSFESYNSRTNHYEAFAREHASVTGDHPHQFFVDMGNYENVDVFNARRRQVRDYISQYSGDDDWWEWDDMSNRQKFKDLRISADLNKNRMYYIIGGMALNRIVSAIDAARGLTKEQKEMKKKMGLSLGFAPNSIGISFNW